MTRLAAISGLASLALVGSAKASVPSITPSTVIAGDTYSIEVVGYNTADPSGDIYLVYPLNTPNFGTTTTYSPTPTSAAPVGMGALGGQALTVVSSESVIGGVTTDFFALSVPTNFVPTGTKDNHGNIINAIQFSIGTYLGGTNPVNLTGPNSISTATQSVLFKFNGVSLSQSALATATLASGGTALSAFGQTTTTNSGDISNNQITGLSLSITYAAVPEPSTNAAVLLGAAGLIGTIVVRNRRRARA